MLSTLWLLAAPEADMRVIYLMLLAVAALVGFCLA
jgi:hypothetical protein